MALTEIKIAPGLFTVTTDRGAVNRWKSGNKVRFHNGMPQKLGGWLKYSNNTFRGICRLLFDFASLALVRYRAIGTHTTFYVETGGTFSNITPIRSTGTYANDPFAVVDTSTTVTVTH